MPSIFVVDAGDNGRVVRLLAVLAGLAIGISTVALGVTPVSAAVFADVPATHWASQAIETIYLAGVTAGCATGPARYCPDAPVTRAQAAVLLLKGAEDPSYAPPPCSAPAFDDVPCESPFAAWIYELVRRGGAVGCGVAAFCPGASVTRAQMAVLLTKIVAPFVTPAPCITPPFADVPCTSPAAPWVGELVRRRVTSGCDPVNFCPDRTITRAEAAVLLVKRFGLGGDFTLVGIHPGADAQPTAVGRMLVTLSEWQGRLYAGYGDFNANTGPIAVSAWDPALPGLHQHWVSCTEAIYNYRAIAGRLYAPAIDPAGAPRCMPPADFAVGEPWSDHVPLQAFHVFDAATTGTDVWMVGSQGFDAVAWRSVDGGAHWAEARRVLPASGAGFARFYFVGVLGGKLYLQAVNAGASTTTPLVFDPATGWAPGPNLLPRAGDVGWRPVVFAGQMVYQTLLPSDPPGARLLAFGGGPVTQPLPVPIFDFTVSGAALLALGTDGVVWRTTDLADWAAVATAPAGSRSIGALAGRIYVGTATAELYRLRTPTN